MDKLPTRNGQITRKKWTNQREIRQKTCGQITCKKWTKQRKGMDKIP